MTAAEFRGRHIIDSRRLFFFYHVAANGSFSRAEAALNAPQPVISRHITKLEEELGVQLLKRNGRGVTLTRCGEILFQGAETILDNMATTIGEIDTAKRNPGGRVRIAAPATVMSLYMPEVVRRFMAELPEVEIVAIQTLTGEIYGQLLADKVDIGLLLQMPNKVKFDVHPLLIEPMLAIAAKHHPLAARGTIGRAEIAEARLVVPSLSHGLRQLIDDYMARERLTVTAHLQVDSIPLIREVVGQGDLLTLLPQSTCQLEFGSDRFAFMELDPPLTRSLFAAQHKDRDQPHVDTLMRHLIDVFREKADELRDRAGD